MQHVPHYHQNEQHDIGRILVPNTKRLHMNLHSKTELTQPKLAITTGLPKNATDRTCNRQARRFKNPAYNVNMQLHYIQLAPKCSTLANYHFNTKFTYHHEENTGQYGMNK